MDKFVEKDAEGPDIKLVVMVTMIDHLRRHVFERPAECVPLPFILLIIYFLNLAFDGPAEVANLEHIIFIDK